MDPRPALNGADTPVSANETAVIDAVRATPFGTVEVVLHQSRIVQIVRTEKVRLTDDVTRGC